MRWVAGGLYALLCVYQMFIAQSVIQGASLTNAYFTWLYAVAVVPLSAIMAVWMLSGKKTLPETVRRGVCVATLLIVVFELITNTEQSTIIDYTLYNVLPALYGKTFALYVLVAIRLLLMAMAAFFVYSSNADEKSDDKEDEADDDIEVIEIIEVTEGKKTDADADEDDASDEDDEADADEETEEDDELNDTDDDADEDEDKGKDEKGKGKGKK